MVVSFEREERGEGDDGGETGDERSPRAGARLLDPWGTTGIGKGVICSLGGFTLPILPRMQAGSVPLYRLRYD